MDVLRRHIFEVHLIDGGAGLHIQRHLGRRHDIVQFQFRVLPEGGQV